VQPSQVYVSPVTAWHALELVAQLRQVGLITHEDFSWCYHKPQWNSTDGTVPGSVMFEFRNPTLATFYQLKWGVP
jgi:hypothetical protein